MAVYDVDINGLRVSAAIWHADGDPVWVSVRPNLRRIHVLAGDILEALGKTRDVSGKGRNESEDVQPCRSLAGSSPHDGARTRRCPAPSPRILHSVTKLAATANVDLWLLHRPPMTDIVHRAIRRRSTTTATFEEVPQTIQSSAAPITATSDWPDVPNHDFHLFAAAVNATLQPPEAGTVLAALRTGIIDAEARIVSSVDPQAGVIATLTQLIRTVPVRAELVTGVRAIQTAAWNHDLHVSVDLTQFLNSEERPRVSPNDAAQALLAYRQPYRSIAWILSHHGVGVEEASCLPSSATDATGSTIATTIGTIAVPRLLTTAVRAQRALRSSEGAQRDEPLLPYTAKTLGYALTDAAKDLGLPTHGRLAERQSIAPLAWLKKLGIIIRKLP